MYVEYVYMTNDLAYSYVSSSWNTSNMKLDKQQRNMIQQSKFGHMLVVSIFDCIIP